jgi:hypothetical protein
MSVRFVRPAFPGDTIRVELFACGTTVRFRARALERDELVLDRGLGFLQRHDLGFGEDKALLRHPGFERLEPRLGVRQIVAQPDGPHTEWRDRQALFLQLVATA